MLSFVWYLEENDTHLRVDLLVRPFTKRAKYKRQNKSSNVDSFKGTTTVFLHIEPSSVLSCNGRTPDMNSPKIFHKHLKKTTTKGLLGVIFSTNSASKAFNNSINTF